MRHCLEFDGCLATPSGSVAAYSGKYTGRNPRGKFIVRDEGTESLVWWAGNQSMSPRTYLEIRSRAIDYIRGRRTYVVDTFAGADPRYRIKVRFIVERAYHALFVHQLLMRPTPEELCNFVPDWTILDAAKLMLDPLPGGIGTEAIIALNLTGQEVVVTGTQYAGELKKSVFTIMNYLLPAQGVVSMHCSANRGPAGDTALFFGLSGTGKTSLSADPSRDLIGDDEHGWSDHGVFNLEGGCYAKCINLNPEKEPEIWNALTDGTVLENVVLGPEGEPDFANASITENTRAAYPLDHIPHAADPSVGGHPANIMFLTCDALGVLPPISLLDREQTKRFFLSGYTAKVAGTEAGVIEPTVTFSACFGQPFLPLPPKSYSELLISRIAAHGAKVWLLNTGWTGGPYGVGSRIQIRLTRAMLHAAIEGNLDAVAFRKDPIFGLKVPVECPGVPSGLLDPRGTWPEPSAYDLKAAELQRLFEENAASIGVGS